MFHLISKHREFKIQCYFWRNLRCLELRWDTVSRVWYITSQHKSMDWLHISYLWSVSDAICFLIVLVKRFRLIVLFNILPTIPLPYSRRLALVTWGLSLILCPRALRMGGLLKTIIIKTAVKSFTLQVKPYSRVSVPPGGYSGFKVMGRCKGFFSGLKFRISGFFFG